MEEQPDLAISVDLGTTFTGVAWMRHGIPIQVVNDWPGSDDRGDRKVPTTIVYNADGSISSWGFMCADDDHDTSKTRRDFFKIFLDPETLDAAQHQGLSNARRFVTDYLKQIYAHIKDSIEMRMGIKHVGGWDSMAVLFLFSAPTTWTSMAIINTFKGAIHDAGFGTGGPKHSALVDLTDCGNSQDWGYKPQGKQRISDRGCWWWHNGPRSDASHFHKLELSTAFSSRCRQWCRCWLVTY
ncbi:hypothetical protein LB503_012256 [Fusarium chuoi]|nr:hypothetical protein LB503_012256 [Fusarium chuoi]